MSSSLSAAFCANCAKDTARMRCKGCKDTLSVSGGHISPTVYCNTACQKAHWKMHKSTCKASQDRQILYRAGETAQLAFYTYREVVFDKSIARVESDGKNMTLQQGFHDIDLLIPFPTELFPCLEDKHAILSFMACSDAVGYMHEIIKTMLTGITSGIEEILVGRRFPRRQLIWFDIEKKKDENEYFHQLLRVTLSNGEKYAFDITGAQYGYHESVVPWHQYIDSQVKEIVGTDTFGMDRTIAVSDELCGEPGYPGLIMSCNKEFMKVFDSTVRDWQKENITLSAMLKLPEEAFRQRRASLMEYIERLLIDFRKSRTFIVDLCRPLPGIEIGKEMTSLGR